MPLKTSRRIAFESMGFNFRLVRTCPFRRKIKKSLTRNAGTKGSQKAEATLSHLTQLLVLERYFLSRPRHESFNEPDKELLGKQNRKKPGRETRLQTAN
jgi:hypothetical protein